MKDAKGSASLGLSAVLLVVGLAVGFGASKVTDNNDMGTANSSSKNNNAPTSVTKAADLRASLVSLGVQHMDLTAAAVDATLAGAPNASAVAADLYKNGTDIGAAIGSVYGKDAETTFNTVWKLHLDDFVKYAGAASAGDEAAKAAALADIDANYTHPLAAYLAKANPNLPEKTLYAVLGDHVMMTADMIDLHVKGDYAAETAKRDEAAHHLTGVFSTLAGGIVKQFPDKFRD